MGVKGGYGIISDGLILGMDTGFGIGTKDTPTGFYRGMPTANYVSDAHKMEGWNSYSNGNDGTLMTEFGTVGYTMNKRLSWNGLYKDFTLPSTGTYTFSGYYRYLGGSSSNNGATCYISGYGGGDTATTINKGILGDWQRIERTVNVTDVTVRFFAISYGGSSSSDYSSWQFTMPQIEKVGTRTVFTKNTRSSTDNLIDLAGNSRFTVNTDYDTNQLPTFNGSTSYIQIPDDVFTTNGSYTLNIWLRPNGSSWGNNAIPTYNTYTSSSSVGFWHHFGHDNILRWRHGGSSYTTGDLSGIGLVANTWQMTTITWDRTTLRLYKNGSQTNSTTAPSDFNKSGGGARIGMLSHRNTANDYNWNGNIAHHTVYNRALTANEIAHYYDVTKTRFGL
jgi:hypothetical protein